MISIVIPAHNEARNIQATLSGLLPGIESGEFEVVVVCNGCTDRTAAVVREVSGRIDCVEVETPSKTHALNVGDSRAHCFPRIYMDADIRMVHTDLLALAGALGDGKKLAVSPRMQMDLSRSSWAVRAYYEIWSQLPYCQEGLIGAGTYALSEAGRARFGEFPDIIADDGYVRLQFTSEERGAVEGVFSIVTAPSHLAGLIKIKTRSRLGEYQLKALFPELYENDNKNYAGAMTGFFFSWRGIPKAVMYLLINVYTRLRARIQLKRAGRLEWERDESSRRSE